MKDRQATESRARVWSDLYDKYGLPLEKEHSGDFLAVSPTGRILLAKSFDEAVTQSTQAFGKGNFIYKVGERSVGTALWVDSSSARTIPISHSIRRLSWGKGVSFSPGSKLCLIPASPAILPCLRLCLAT